VAGLAVGSETPFVDIVLFVASDTGARNAGQLAVDMAVLASDGRVRSGERETGLRVVKHRRVPVFYRVAGGAIWAQAPLMGVVSLVAADTGLGCGLQGGDRR